jgi:VWFA-related protein
MSRTKLLALFAMAACVALGQNLTLHLTATDSQGHPVADLTADEVRITDEGKAQSIASFHKEAPRAATALAPGELTNRPAGLANAHVVLFDLLNLPATDRRTSADQIVRALQHLEHAEFVYLYVLGVEGELVPVRALPAAAPVPISVPWTADVAAPLEKAIGPIAAQRSNYTTDVVFRSKTTYAVLENLAGRMAPIPGRKTISWITIGMARSFPRENGEIFDSMPFLRQSANRIAQAGVGINPVAKLSGSDAPENRDTMQAFADLTGGKLYQGGDIERALPEIIQDSRTTYRVQYTPKTWDGKFHKVHATSTRKGVNIQCEQGFMAEKQPDRPDTFQSPFDAADLGIRATVSPGAQPNIMRLHLNIDPQDLQLDRPLQLVLSVTGYMPDGKMVSYAPGPINSTLTPEQRDKMARDGLRLGHEVTVTAGMRKVRLAVEDRTTKTTGTLTIPVAN